MDATFSATVCCLEYRPVRCPLSARNFAVDLSLGRALHKMRDARLDRHLLCRDYLAGCIFALDFEALNAI